MRQELRRQISWKIHRLEKDYEIDNLYFHDQEK